MQKIGFAAIEDASGLHLVCYENGNVTGVTSGLLGGEEGEVGRALRTGSRPRGGQEIAAFRLAAAALANAADHGRAAVVAVREEDGTSCTFPERMSALCKRAFGIPVPEVMLS